MHLINTTTGQLEKFASRRTTPRYAILSHTWGPDEMTYKQITKPRTPFQGAGYHKVKRCSEIALALGYPYLWVDTCCIDKSSSAELSEAINSMYSYYSGASLCIAYLVDVPPGDEDAFANSRWFTRGWTLQELIAPPRLIFYSQDWSVLGKKKNMIDQLCSITNIDREVLRDPWTKKHVCIARRMSWASKRDVTRDEDESYCLMGIFDVNMPLLYGEGAKKAFLRLEQEILKQSNDQSLFAWTAGREFSWSPVSGGLLAHSPREFAECTNYKFSRDRQWNTFEVHPYDMTNLGLRITLPIIKDEDEGKFIAILNCEIERGAYAGIYITPTENINDEYGFLRMILQKPTPVTMKRPSREVRKSSTAPGDVFCQAPGTSLQKVGTHLMYFEQIRELVVD